MSLYSCRLGRLFAACRLSIILASSLLIATRFASAATLAGQVTDPDGRGMVATRNIVVNSLGVVAGAVTESYAIRRPGEGRAATHLYARAGTGIRPPDAFEIAFTGKPNLEPERSRSFDSGIGRQIAGGAYNLGATAFFNPYDDLITVDAGISVPIGRGLQVFARGLT